MFSSLHYYYLLVPFLPIIASYQQGNLQMPGSWDAVP